MQGHCTVRQLQLSEYKDGLALLAESGFRSAIEDGVTEAEVLLGAVDASQGLVGALRARTIRQGCSRTSEIGLLGVINERRRQGIGRALLDEFCHQEFSFGAANVDVHVAPEALVSLRRFYEACGFHQADGYYRRWRDP